jgi:hypothetical protein
MRRTRGYNKKTKEEILERFYERWKDEFDYSYAKFNGMKIKIWIFHPKCQSFFEQTPDWHLRLTYGCPECANKIKGKYRANTTENFIKRLIEARGDEYDYSEVVYVTNEKIIITHKTCNYRFLQEPYDHLKGKGCPECFGSKKKTLEQFIEEARNAHGDEYDYSESIYINNNELITIKHKCGYVFHQRPINHINGQGCAKCAGNAKITPTEFLERFADKWGDNFDYSESCFNGPRENILIKHKICGTKFYQTPDLHLRSVHSCPHCSLKERSLKLQLTQEEFLTVCHQVHKNEYDLSEFVYEGKKSYGWITHKICGHRFNQNAGSHMYGQGCPPCARLRIIKGVTKTHDEFLEEAIETHGQDYDYTNSFYTKADIKIEIRHKKCNKTFWQSPHSHIRGQGCPHCKCSKMELYAAKFLDTKEIKYEQEKKFLDCKDKLPLPFDFFISPNICIEMDGIQHGKPIDFFGGVKAFEELKKRDQIKNNYCKENNIILFRIKYDQDIEEEMNKIYDYLIN